MTKHPDASGDVTHDVVGERHILDDRPGRGAVLVADGEQDGSPKLPNRAIVPIILEDIAVDKNSLRILQLEIILDDPVDARIAWMAHSPGQRFDNVVVPN